VFGNSLLAQGYKNKREQIEAEKIAFFTEKIDLSPEEAAKFWPLYNKYHSKLEMLHDERRNNMHFYLDNHETIGAAEAMEIADTHVESKAREAKVLIEFHEEMKKVLPPGKIIKVYAAEREFRHYLIKRLRGRHGGGGAGRGPRPSCSPGM
jgi:hypothetical protein